MTIPASKTLRARYIRPEIAALVGRNYRSVFLSIIAQTAEIVNVSAHDGDIQIDEVSEVSENLTSRFYPPVRALRKL
jgi:hypothetical protein